MSAILEDVGIVQNIVCNRTTGHVVDGHLRVMLALRNNQPLVPVTWIEVSEAEEKLIISSLDPLAAMAAADKERLDALLREIPPVDARLQEMLAELAKKEGLYLDESDGTDTMAAVIPQQYIIMIECAGEAEQSTLLERLLSEGIQCKALIS